MKDYFKKFYPTFSTPDTYHIDFSRLYKMGYRGVIFDIDNTLVGHDAPSDYRCQELIHKLKAMGFKTVIVSNNGESRVSKFAKANNCTYVYRALKPSGMGYIKALDKLGLDKSQVICVGDQLFTDIWGANRAGVDSILVGRLFKKEAFHIYIKRVVENFVLRRYYRLRKENIIPAPTMRNINDRKSA